MSPACSTTRNVATGMTRFDPDLLRRLGDVMTGHAQADRVGGVAWLAACADDVEVGVAGTLTRGDPDPIRRDSLFRIASMTKPIVAVAALLLVEECKLRLEDPVDELLPELADRRVLVDAHGPVDGATVPAHRPISVYDVLTFRLGLGMDFSAPWPQPLLEAMDALGLGAGPPAPSGPPGSDEWMRRLSTLPLLHQPGERWLYHTGADVLGVLVARASGQPLEEFLRARVFEPLGMVDTGFSTERVDRLGSCYTIDPVTGGRAVFDAPAGQWATPPAFPSGGGGLVSTLDDYHAFGRMLLAGGRLPDGTRLLSRASVEAMTTDHVGADGPSLDGSGGWGFGVGVQVRRIGLGPTVGSYGWSGGLGSSWASDPGHDLVGVVLTTDAFVSAFPPPAVIQDFWTCVYAALED
jgi:CubicO group peptidase (beta-lactamase class C family)